MTHVGRWGQWLSSTCPGRSPCEQFPGVYSRTSLRCRRTISLLVCLEDDCHLSFPALPASRDDDFASCICVQTVVASCVWSHPWWCGICWLSPLWLRCVFCPVLHVCKQQTSWKSLSPGHLGDRCKSDACTSINRLQHWQTWPKAYPPAIKFNGWICLHGVLD